MLVLKNWKYGLKKLIMFDTMQNCIMFWPMHWLFSTAWGSVELDLEAGFVCPFVHWPCQFRRENSGFPGLLLDHPQALIRFGDFCLDSGNLCWFSFRIRWIFLSGKWCVSTGKENNCNSREKSGQKYPFFPRQTAQKWHSTIFLWKISCMSMHNPCLPCHLCVIRHAQYF